MGANVKEFLRLVEDFVSMISVQMSGFQDIYEVTDNLGETRFPLPAVPCDSSFLQPECINHNLTPGPESV